MRCTRTLARAVGLSATVMAALVTLHASHWLWIRQGNPDLIVRRWVRDVVLLDQDRTALVLYSVHPPRDHGNRQAVEIHDLVPNRVRRDGLLSHGLPWLVAASRDSHYGFVCSESSGLYWFDVASAPPKLRQIGTSAGDHAEFLLASGDGALVLLVRRATASVWDRTSGLMIWARDGLPITSCEFVPRSHRVLCGLATGELLELDPKTGRTLRLIENNLHLINSLSISEDGSRIAFGDAGCNCLVRELASGRCLWSHECARAPLVRFATDGESLLVTDPSQGLNLTRFSIASGQPLVTLTGLKSSINQVRVTRTGTAWLSCQDSTVTGWDLQSGQVITQFKVAATL
jgi:hypothetical protein